MDIYLPVAEMSVNLFLLLGLGGMVGFLSGVFGVGGGFIMTPLLIFIGIPPAVAVGSGASQILASSTSGAIAHTRRRTVDFRMGWVLIVGGAIGSGLGILLFRWLRATGQIDVVIALAYVLFLGVIGALMFAESARALFRTRKSSPATRRRKLHQHHWLHGLPMKMRFNQSRLYISVLTPLAVGAGVGVLVAIMGVGGGFIMVPAMIYLIGMPTSVVIGTSLFQIAFVTAITSFLHAYTNQAVDIVLALLLIAGGVIGVQFGSRAGAVLRGEQLRILLALLVLAVAVKMAWDLVATPADVFSLA
ncbi:MAG: sulfite exporter TauE/SafE family protein, partial [Geminicoccaceae bacterium]